MWAVPESLSLSLSRPTVRGSFMLATEESQNIEQTPCAENGSLGSEGGEWPAACGQGSVRPHALVLAVSAWCPVRPPVRAPWL